MARPAKRPTSNDPERPPSGAASISHEEAPAAKPRKALPYPRGLGTGGRLLWREVTIEHELDIVQRITLEEACRMKDRLDKFDLVFRGDVDAWLTIRDTHHGAGDELLEIHVDDAVGKANQTANTMKQLLASMRLPDASGARPQQRGGARGAYVSGGADSGADSAGAGGGSKLGNLRGLTGGRST
jgi:hypothetical protein